jgi:hypothetical protein
MGCPVQAIVAAFGFDERTVAAWWTRSGRQGQAVHEYLIAEPRDLGQVQADELRVHIAPCGRAYRGFIFTVIVVYPSSLFRSYSDPSSHATPERQSLCESHRQRRWLTRWSYF